VLRVDEGERRLPAVAVRHVAVAAQRQLAPDHERRQRPDRGVPRQCRLDPGEPDLAAVLQPDAARIGHRHGAALALRWRIAVGSDRLAAGRGEQSDRHGQRQNSVATV